MRQFIDGIIDSAVDNTKHLVRFSTDNPISVSGSIILLIVIIIVLLTKIPKSFYKLKNKQLNPLAIVIAIIFTLFARLIHPLASIIVGVIITILAFLMILYYTDDISDEDEPSDDN
jgi:CBS domain containing-hemolysin-like protein